MEICFSNQSAGRGVKEITSKLKNLRFDDLKVAGGVRRYSYSLTKLLSEFKMMTPIDLFKVKNLLCEFQISIPTTHINVVSSSPELKSRINLTNPEFEFCVDLNLVNYTCLLNFKDYEGIAPLRLWTSTILPQTLSVLPNKELADVNALTSFKAIDIPCDLPNSENIDIKFDTIVPEAGTRACDLTNQRIEHNDDYSHRGLSNMCDLVNQRKEHNDDCSHRGLSNRSSDISTIKSIMGSRNVLLLIATLLTTITYQVPFHILGSASKMGYVHNYITGTFQLNKQYSLLSSTFMLSNSAVFIASVLMTLFLLHEFPFKPWPQISVLALFGSYMCLIKTISTNGALALLVISIPFLLLVAARKIYGLAS
ncbi:hypothetical protein HYC85_000233 [Camellia sinensis]|uniref:PGG domain-containing protein n=1 Tax=Camellia sinensis TaxID=4442 RepID=A0A7J7I3M7_CAMSI|nr:hypothetical protein HYC85_000233 [Camellia sinensis]